MTLLEETRNYIKDKDLKNVFSGHIKLYPKDGNHIEIKFYDLDLKIQYGLDPFAFDGYKKMSKPNYWYVIHKNDVLINKGFTSFEIAIQEGIEVLRKKTEDELKILNNYQTQLF